MKPRLFPFAVALLATLLAPLSGPCEDKDLSLPGVPNLHQVTPHYFRGGQPTKQGFAELKKMGIKTVVNLRSFHSDRDELKGTHLLYERIWSKPWHPEEEDVRRFLLIVTNPARQPVYVHCRYGSDRTGMMTAIYRIVVQNWTKDEAIREMTQGGFGFHPRWSNLIQFIEKLDTESLKKQGP